LRALAHPETVVHAAFSRDGRYVATSCEEPVARVWDVERGKLNQPILRPKGDVTGSIFSPDGQKLLTVANRRNLQLWDWRTCGSIGPELTNDADVQQVLFSADGQCIATAGSEGIVRIWKAGTGQLVARFQHHGSVDRLAFSPDGRWLVTGSKDGFARVWDLAHQGPARAILPSGAEVHAVAFSPDGERVAVGGSGGAVRIWESAANEPSVRTFAGTELIWAELNPDGNKVVTASTRVDQGVRVWDVATGAPLTPCMPHPDSPRFARFSPDGTRLLTFVEGNDAFIWDASNGQQL